MTSALLATVREALDDLAVGVPVVLAVSGGPDSVGLACLVAAARPDLQATVVHICHGLRDAAVDAADAEIARTHARALGMPAQVVAVQVTRDGAGPEAAARRARLGALAAAARSLGAGDVLTGHTADDQAETVLLNLARGAGLPGLAGMPAARELEPGVMLRHPLLGLRRADVRAVAAATELELADDPTNQDPAQRRARARHQLLPALASLTGAATDPVVSLERLARHARRDTAALDDLAAAALATAALRWGPVLAVPHAAIAAQPLAVSTRIVRLLLAAAHRGEDHVPSEAAVDAVLSLREGHRLDLADDLLVSRGGGLVAAVARTHAVLPARRGVGTVALPELGLAVTARTDAGGPMLPPWAPARAATGVAVPAARDLVVRARRAGDRITTTAGTQKLSEAMVAAGVPRAARDLVPVITDEEGILWVPGVAVRRGATGPLRLQLVAERGQ